MALNLKDFIGPCCACPECYQAGVTTLETRRDPWTGEWLHGQKLREWHESRNAFLRLKAAISPKVMP